MDTPIDIFRRIVADTGDRVAAIRSVRERFGFNRRQAQEVMIQVEGIIAVPHGLWPDHEYVPYLDAEQQLYAWVLSKVGGVEAAEAMKRAAARFYYEPVSERGVLTHEGAWRIAMADLFGNHRRQPEEFGLAAEFEATVQRLFHGE